MSSTPAWETGQLLKPLTKPAITREQLKAYASASGDPNPIHLDETFAKEAGFPSVIAHGMLSMAFLGDHIRFNFPETHYQVQRFKVKFKKVTFPGDVLSCEGSVRKVGPDEITVIVRTKNQKGEVTTEGEATLLPLS
jgi:acyl dehydratase